MSELKQVYQVGERTFDSKAEAENFIRRPKIQGALNGFIKGNEGLVNWLIEHQEEVEDALDTGTIRRVTKADRKALGIALDQVVAEHKGDSKLKFLFENAEAIKEGFRWPAVKRLNAEEKAAAAREALTLASEGNEKLANFVVENKDQILEAYQAGVVKREVTPQAAAGLSAYRERMAAEKAAREAGGTDAATTETASTEPAADASQEAGTDAAAS